mgnify:CR=1 FL=1
MNFAVLFVDFILAALAFAGQVVIVKWFSDTIYNKREPKQYNIILLMITFAILTIVVFMFGGALLAYGCKGTN